MERRLRQKVSKSYRKSSEKVREKFPKSTSAVSHGKTVITNYQNQYPRSISASIKIIIDIISGAIFGSIPGGITAPL